MAVDLMPDAVPQLQQVSQVFGKPYAVGDKTLIPVSQVFLGLRPIHAGRVTVTKPVALVEVDQQGKVNIKAVFNSLPIAILGMLVGAWNVYWIAKTIREWRRGRDED